MSVVQLHSKPTPEADLIATRAVALAAFDALALAYFEKIRPKKIRREDPTDIGGE